MSNILSRPLSLSFLRGGVIFTLAALLLLHPAAAFTQTNSSCIDVIVRSGDTLSRLATQYLGELAAYTRIVAATNAKATSDASYARITNPSLLEVGWKLCVPAGSGGATAQSIQLPPTPTPAIVPSTIADPLLAAEEAGQWYRDEVAKRWNGSGPHPLTIDFIRQQTYPGSDIIIEQTLAPGSNYQRYLVSYRSEGFKIYAYMTIPAGQRPSSGWPVVIFNHGYIPPEIYRSTERYIAYADGFARNGYIVFRSDYRGHAFSEGEANGAYGLPDYTIDVLNGLASVKRHAEADANRIGMWGHSLGGYITIRAMVVNKEIKAGVIWAGVVASYPDLLSKWSNRPPASIPQRARRWRQVLIDQWGTPETNPQFWNSISANSFLADLSGPIQLHHGTNDADVPAAFSATLYDQAIAAGKTAENYLYQGDDHNLSRNFNTAMQRSIAFFDTHVKN